MSAGREAHLVELVDEEGRPVGEATVAAAHRSPGMLHRAFSVLLTAPGGRVLLQRRAAVKTRFPLRWGNACCGHPAPGQAVTEAATIRLGEELGLAPVPLTEIGVYVYRAQDPATGRVEVEYDHVLLGRIAADHSLRPDPAEVAELHWTPLGEALSGIDTRPDDYAPWLAGVLSKLHLDSQGSL
ncbi:isopentenyl-diphosphate Delta-isomerase [Phytohabitans kaempferiae]|uniref:Isopentenyl-diphosphate Delta-isomerase n=1 Tax=Phytohabitans kaempferiae TaxID=1620943 RepID=A0ABV6LUU4_9ACTN